MKNIRERIYVRVMEIVEDDPFEYMEEHEFYERH